MHDGVQKDPIQVQGQGHEPSKTEIRPFSKAISSSIYNGGWQMTTHFYIRAQYLKLIGAGFLIFVLVLVSRDFELGTVRPLRGVDRQSRTGLFLYMLPVTLSSCDDSAKH